ncbi:hypothetical protein BJX61DRAFT_546404 [Aspergillus egyptiacus]|nr:hypothetical protein BJX61DRAFT_546404 [Aspergillus egyptiacus]
MHKMAPNSGQGANCAIEDVAELLSLLRSSRQTHGDDFRASLHDIDMRLEQYNRMRVRRTQKIDKDARTLARLLTRDNLLLKLVGRYYLPHSGNSLVDQFSAHLVDSVLVDWLPQPKRSGPYWSSDVGKPSSQRPRFVAAAVLVVFLLGLQASPVRLKSSWMNLVTG